MMMRSKLFVPASRPDLFGKALRSKADALSFDLEDAVAPDRKDEARADLADLLRSDAALESTARLVARVNPVGSPQFEADIAAVACRRLDLLNLPKVEDARSVRRAASLLDRYDPDRRIGLLLTIETPRGLRRAAALAASHPRVRALQAGYADLLEPAGIDRMDQTALGSLRLVLRLAAAEAGLPAFDAAFPGLDDTEGYRAECEAARRCGFSGKSCVHPRQIAVANAVFSPDDAEIARARAILAAVDRVGGGGAIRLEGTMVDAPFVARARAVIALAETLGERTVRENVA